MDCNINPWICAMPELGCGVGCEQSGGKSRLLGSAGTK